MSAWELTRADVGNALALIGEAMRPHLGHEHKINLVHAALIAGASPTIAARDKRIGELEAENDRLSDERDEALHAPWPKWAEEIRAKLISFGVETDDVDGCNLPEAFEEFLDDLDRADEKVTTQADTIATLQRRVEAAEKALKFYADPANWIDTPPWDGDPNCVSPKAVPVTKEDGRPCDCGDTARAALASVLGGTL